MENRDKTLRNIATGAIIAGLYAALTILLAPISYYAIQVRISEALTLLPFVYPSAIWGLFLGCMIANIFGGLGPYDIFLGSTITLIAAYLTYLLRKTKNPYLAPLPPIILNGLGVSAYLVYLLHILPEKNISHFSPYLSTSIFIMIGETISTYIIGLPILLLLLKKNKK